MLSVTTPDPASDKRWVEEAKLEAHSDWVRDTAWAPRYLINIFIGWFYSGDQGSMLDYSCMLIF